MGNAKKAFGPRGRGKSVKVSSNAISQVENLSVNDIVDARRDGLFDVKGRRKIVAKALDSRYFSAPDSFERVERVIVYKFRMHKKRPEIFLKKF